MCFPSAVKQALHNQQRTFFLRIQIKSCCNIVKALQNNVLTRVTSVSPAGNPFITLAYLRFRVATQLRGVCLFTQSRTAFQASSYLRRDMSANGQNITAGNITQWNNLKKYRPKPRHERFATFPLLKMKNKVSKIAKIFSFALFTVVPCGTRRLKQIIKHIQKKTWLQRSSLSNSSFPFW